MIRRGAGIRDFFYNLSILYLIAPTYLHVFKSDAEVKIELVEPRVFNVEGKIGNKDLAKALSLVIEYQVELLEKWKEIHE